MRRHSLHLAAVAGAFLAATAMLLAPALAEGSEGDAEDAADTASVPVPSRPALRDQTCLSGADLREAVSERRVVEPIAAIRAAREAVPRAEIVRVNLCHREGEALVYVITALRRNGRFVHVTVDSQSGAVDSLQ